MNAGLELDMLVAEKVLGQTDFDLTKPDTVRRLPRYSEEIAPAWALAAHLGLSVLKHPDNDGYTAGRICETHPEMFSVSITLEHVGQAHTAPMAICLAALATVGVKVPA